MLVTFQAFSALFDYLHSLFFSVLCSKMLKNFDKKALSKRFEIEAIFFLVHLLLLAMILKFLDMEKKHSRF
jgi:hypothetical protein